MVETKKKIIATCFHCGDQCADSSIQSDTRVFCCNGCKTVYELLNESAMCDYYLLENAPGNKVKEKNSHEYAFLEEEKIINSLLKFKEGDVSAITLHLPAIHCSSCIWLLENLHKMHPGIITSDIQFQHKLIDVQFNKSISLRQLAELLSAIGYPPLITFNGKELTNKSLNKSLYYKLGIAGFCFGNIMMLSLPEYLSVKDAFTGEIKNLFTFLSLVLALPVFFYSASDYFISAYRAIQNKMINIDLPIALGLLAAFSQSSYEIFTFTGPGYMDSLTGLVFFLLIGKWYQNKTYEALSFERDYKSYFPLAVNKVTPEKTCFVPLSELKTGDIIIIRNQEIIPADCVITEGNASIDYSFVTGESVPASKELGAQVFAGGKQIGAAIKVKLTKEVSESYLTQLWNKDNSKVKSAGLAEFTNKVGKYFTIAVMIISLGTYLYWVGKDSATALYSAVSVLIIFCPCTLALAIPFCFGNAMNLLGKNGFFLKNTETIEKLAQINAIVFDKTGTITCSQDAEMEWEGFLRKEELTWVRSLVNHSTHPLSRMIGQDLKEGEFMEADYFEEIASRGIRGKFGSKEIKIGSAPFVGLQPSKNQIRNSFTRVYISIDGKIKGCYLFKNKYRPGMETLLHNLSEKFDLHLLSGDNDAERDYLSEFFLPTKLYFNQTPTNKLEYVDKLSRGNKVMMVGDGLNDAGALLHSNCGIAITENSANFSPACDGILEATKFSRLPDFLKYSRACLQSVYWSLGVSLVYNIIGLFFAVQGELKPLVAAILMPLSSVSVVLFVTLMSNLWAKKYHLK